MRALDPLMQPFQLKGLEFKNRIMSTAHAPGYAHDGKPKAQYQLYHEEKAKGGVALTMFGGSSNIAPDSASVFGGQIYVGDDTIVPYFTEFSQRIHRHGAALICQITHMGRRTVWNADQWLPTIAPSRVREPQHRSFPKEMEPEDIDRVIAAYAAAARRCKEGGLDGCEILTHGHIIDQFFSPITNKRTDRYGGPLENRMRFGLEVFEAIRGSVGDDFIVGLRICGGERRSDGLSEQDCLQIARSYADTGRVDYLNRCSVAWQPIWNSRRLSCRAWMHLWPPFWTTYVALKRLYLCQSFMLAVLMICPRLDMQFERGLST
jgi:2,4-dienoyl-CoA reductase-like NADH-dependent reductase (Old Yellow Enzyme family)